MPAIIAILFASRIMGFPRGRCRELLESHRVPPQKSYAVFMRPTVLPMGYVGIDWRRHIKRSPCLFSRNMRGSIFPSVSRIRMGMIRLTGCRVSMRTSQRSLVAINLTRPPNNWYILTPCVDIVSGNSVSSAWHQAVTWTNTDLLSIKLNEITLLELEHWYIVQRHAFKNAMFKMSATRGFGVLYNCQKVLDKKRIIPIGVLEYIDRVYFENQSSHQAVFIHILSPLWNKKVCSVEP